MYANDYPRFPEIAGTPKRNEPAKGSLLVNLDRRVML
jgi:hypothetical protein